MKIKRVTWSHRYDFSADMECEHCGHVEKLTTGYDDANYHENVIPKMVFPACKKDRSGEENKALVAAAAEKKRRADCYDELLEALKDAYPHIGNDQLRMRIGSIIAKAMP